MLKDILRDLRRRRLSRIMKESLNRVEGEVGEKGIRERVNYSWTHSRTKRMAKRWATEDRPTTTHKLYLGHLLQLSLDTTLLALHYLALLFPSLHRQPSTQSFLHLRIRKSATASTSFRKAANNESRLSERRISLLPSPNHLLPSRPLHNLPSYPTTHSLPCFPRPTSRLTLRPCPPHLLPRISLPLFRQLRLLREDQQRVNSVTM